MIAETAMEATMLIHILDLMSYEPIGDGYRPWIDFFQGAGIYVVQEIRHIDGSSSRCIFQRARLSSERSRDWSSRTPNLVYPNYSRMNPGSKPRLCMRTASLVLMGQQKLSAFRRAFQKSLHRQGMDLPIRGHEIQWNPGVLILPEDGLFPQSFPRLVT